MKGSFTISIRRYIADRYTMAASMEKEFRSISTRESPIKVSSKTGRKMEYFEYRKRRRIMKDNYNMESIMAKEY